MVYSYVKVYYKISLYIAVFLNSCGAPSEPQNSEMQAPDGLASLDICHPDKVNLMQLISNIQEHQIVQNDYGTYDFKSLLIESPKSVSQDAMDVSIHQIFTVASPQPGPQKYAVLYSQAATPYVTISLDLVSINHNALSYELPLKAITVEIADGYCNYVNKISYSLTSKCGITVTYMPNDTEHSTQENVKSCICG